MIFQMCFIIMGLMVCSLMILLRILFNEKSTKENLSYECGFESYKLNRLPFSLNFFMVSIIFVLFDLEIIVLVAMIPSMMGLQLNIFFMGNLFLLFMLMSLVLEWSMNKLTWIF
uniref:NADH-ubiquinone oxidoreductase chain 3 n=2 Tax=unclassified Trichuris TaxID=2603576 RepID=A0A8F5DQE6_9BILA|nr:NADH dehydrogenase subunit 3 [Trichuris sp. ETH392]QXJ80346.1 NADH dehydrogenase subunit 3 [Trichuris sp. ETH232]